jgi:hypothetical protein
MNARIKQLRDLVVALDRADRNIEPMHPEAYQAAAKTALVLTGEEMGLLPIGDFAGPVGALQSMAENIFFGINGCFADLDGTGRAPVALTATTALLKRIRATSSGASEEIAESLFTRLRSAASADGPRVAVAQASRERSRPSRSRSRSDRMKR